MKIVCIKKYFVTIIYEKAVNLKIYVYNATIAAGSI